MEILYALGSKEVWTEFLEYKMSHGHLSKKDETSLTALIAAQSYLPIAEQICRGEGFAPPRKSVISKKSSGKKRIVYTYGEKENWVLKQLTWQLQRKYDHLFADNLYSFRPGKSARDAIRRLVSTPDLCKMWCYKVDISNYFNSIPVKRLIPMLQAVLEEEPEIFRFLESLLTSPLVNDHGVLAPEEKGIMAGTPISTFLANLYLAHMDHDFAKRGILYARYSDDIIVFASNEAQREQYAREILHFLAEAGLSVNPEKEARGAPGEKWTFLGICYQDGKVDVAPASVEKLKDKMRRKTRALARWQVRKGATGVQTAKAFVRVFNRKLFENTVANELTWVRWYFPLINTSESLKIIDQYSQSCIRYLATGTHTKAQYSFRYQQIKELGYISLVNRYYSQKDATSAG